MNVDTVQAIAGHMLPTFTLRDIAPWLFRKRVSKHHGSRVQRQQAKAAHRAKFGRK